MAKGSPAARSLSTERKSNTESDSRNAHTQPEPTLESFKTSHTSHEGSVQEPKQGDVEKAISLSSNHDQHNTIARAADDWDGPDDPGNPQNWSGFKKTYHFFPIAFISFAVTVGSSIVSPANEDFQRAFGVSRTAAILPLTVFVIGLGLGPIIAAPLSEQYGRSVVYKIIAPVYILFMMGAGLSKTFGSLIVCRLFAGMAGGPVLAIGGGSNADLFAPKDRAFTAAAFIMAPFLGPAFGPIIGGFCAQFKGWQWTMWASIMLAGAPFLTLLPMQETYKKIILRNRARKLGLQGPPEPKATRWELMRILFTITLFRPLKMLATEPIVFLFAIYNAFTFTIMFAFFPAFPYTFAKEYGFNTWQSGLAFSGIGVGVVLAVVTANLIDRLVYQRKLKEALNRNETTVALQQRLYAGMLGAIGLPIGLFWFAWTARSDIHWISPILAGIPFAWDNLSLFLSATLYQIDVYGPLNGASALAANGLIRYVLGGCFPLWTIQMYEALGIGWATSLLGFVCVAMLPIPFFFFRCGEGIRGRSGMVAK